MSFSSAAPEGADRIPIRDSAVLHSARVQVAQVASGPHPVQVDGTEYAGLPNRPLGLLELRRRLLARSCPLATRDAVWAHVVRRSRTEGPVWQAACLGLGLPMVTWVAIRLSSRFADDPSDVHAAVLTGFLTGLAHIDLDRPGIAVRLRWAAYRAGRRAVREALHAPQPVADDLPPAASQGHPELVLAGAVARGVLRERGAELIAATRLGEQSLAELAAAAGVTYKALHQARRRAEHRLAQSLTQPEDTDLETASSESSTGPVSKTGPSRGVPLCGGERPLPPWSVLVSQCSRWS